MSISSGRIGFGLKLILTASIKPNPKSVEALPTVAQLLLYTAISKKLPELKTTSFRPSSCRLFSGISKFTISLYLLCIFLKEYGKPLAQTRPIR